MVSLSLRQYVCEVKIKLFKNVVYLAFDTNWNSKVRQCYSMIHGLEGKQIIRRNVNNFCRAVGANSKILISLSRNKFV